MKTCTKCGEQKPLSEFFKNAMGKDGLAAACRACWSEHKKRNRGPIIATQNAYRERNKEELRSANKAYQERKGKIISAAWVKANPEKRKETHRAWREANPDKVKKWRKAHPEAVNAFRSNDRARRRGAVGKHTAAQVIELFKKQRGSCAVCRSPLPQGYHKDHVFPISGGGSNDIKNIQLLCPKCNHSKHAKHPIDFMQSLGFLL